MMFIVVLFILVFQQYYCKVQSIKTDIDIAKEEDAKITEILGDPQPGQGLELLTRMERYNEILQTNLNLTKKLDPNGLRFAKELKLHNGPKCLKVAVHIKSKITHYQQVFNYTHEQCYDFEDNVYWTRNLWGDFKDTKTFDCCGR